MDTWKSSGGKSQRREEKKIEAQRREKVRRKEMRKGRRVEIQCVFFKICGSRRSKCRLAKAAGAEPPGQMRDEKLHAVVVRSTFGSQHVQNMRCTFGS